MQDNDCIICKENGTYINPLFLNKSCENKCKYFYHKTCMDKQLSYNKKCLICKKNHALITTTITQSYCSGKNIKLASRVILFILLIVILLGLIGLNFYTFVKYLDEVVLFFSIITTIVNIIIFIKWLIGVKYVSIHLMLIIFIIFNTSANIILLYTGIFNLYVILQVASILSHFVGSGAIARIIYMNFIKDNTSTSFNAILTRYVGSELKMFSNDFFFVCFGRSGPRYAPNKMPGISRSCESLSIAAAVAAMAAAAKHPG